MAVATESVKIEKTAVAAVRRQVKPTRQTIAGYISIAIKEKINRKKPIKTLKDIDYEDNMQGKLLMTALAILTTHNYTDKTPDQVIGILNESIITQH